MPRVTLALVQAEAHALRTEAQDAVPRTELAHALEDARRAAERAETLAGEKHSVSGERDTVRAQAEGLEERLLATEEALKTTVPRPQFEATLQRLHAAKARVLSLSPPSNQPRCFALPCPPTPGRRVGSVVAPLRAGRGCMPQSLVKGKLSCWFDQSESEELRGKVQLAEAEVTASEERCAEALEERDQLRAAAELLLPRAEVEAAAARALRAESARAAAETARALADARGKELEQALGRAQREMEELKEARAGLVPRAEVDAAAARERALAEAADVAEREAAALEAEAAALAQRLEGSVPAAELTRAREEAEALRAALRELQTELAGAGLGESEPRRRVLAALSGGGVRPACEPGAVAELLEALRELPATPAETVHLLRRMRAGGAGGG